MSNSVTDVNINFWADSESLILLISVVDILQSVPVDCEVFQGRSTITIEHLTGEVKPVEKNVGDSIPGGARNLDGMMVVKVCLQCSCIMG